MNFFDENDDNEKYYNTKYDKVQMQKKKVFF